MAPTDLPDTGEAQAHAHAYNFQPRAFGTTVTFRLTPQALEWSSDKGGERIPYGRIARLRASYDPRQLQASRWKLEIWPKSGPKVWLASASWVSLVETTRNDAAYRRFVLALHATLAAANPAVAYVAGRPAWLYWPSLAVAAAAFLAMAMIGVQGLLAGNWPIALLIAAMVAYFGWQMGLWFWRNRPRAYAPGAIPPEVLPPDVPPSATGP